MFEKSAPDRLRGSHPAGCGDAMARLDDAGELLDVDMQHIAGLGMFVANHRDLQPQHLRLVQVQTHQDAADRGPAEAGGLRDPHPGPAFAPQTLPRSRPTQPAYSGGGRELRSRKPAMPASRIASYPLVGTQPPFHNTLASSARL